MKVTVTEIKAKIASLPGNVRDLVTIGEKGSARVKSFTSETVYDVHLEPYKNDPENKEVLNATCGCAAHSLCKHVCAFWAVAKGELPVAGFVSKTGQEDAEPKEDALSAPEDVRDLSNLDKVSMDLINAMASWIGEIKRLLEEHYED